MADGRPGRPQPDSGPSDTPIPPALRTRPWHATPARTARTTGRGSAIEAQSPIAARPWDAPPIDTAALRSEFPVLDGLAYLNAGTNGPVPSRAQAAAEEALRVQVEQGRGGSAFFEGMLIPAAGSLRERVAGLLGCEASEVALTGSTTDGVNSVLSGLDLGPRDEVLTSDEEHPGLLVPLALGARRRGFALREAPFAELAGAVGPDTTLVACSHVSWVTGRLVEAEALAAAEAPVLLDGAQGLGAVRTEVAELGCDFYAASGQKWLCGPNGTGYLYVRSARLSNLHPAWPGYLTLAAPERPLDLELREQADRLDLGLLPFEHSAWAAAAIDVLEAAGFDDVLTAAADRAEELAAQLAEAGRTVSPRGRSTLVSWEENDPEATSRRLADAGVVVRHLPGRPYVRASVGAWTSEEDLERLLRAL